ncbi:hypothetical protein TNCV_4376111 [Trichonephila clavipes]|nr:hypothetical protein TNCV_4376111 [Trichonephila clavipes]
MREDACVRTCQPDYIWSEKLKDALNAVKTMPRETVTSKERQENPFCINCQDFGHSACYTKCPKFPQPKKRRCLFRPD